MDEVDAGPMWVPHNFLEPPPPSNQWKLIRAPELGQLFKDGLEKHLLLDSRSFLEYNTCHIQNAANVCCSKLVKRRLQKDKIYIKDLLTHTCHIDVEEFSDVIVYDQCTDNPAVLTEDNFLMVLLRKLATAFNNVIMLRGGFLAFQAMFPALCEGKSSNYRCTTLTSLSQPCLPVSNIGPTRILPFLYLGSQEDALSQEIIQVNEINYILNVSTTCIKPTYVQDGHFLRIPVNDNYSAKLLPYFNESFQFIDKVREANGCVLVHCLAGISRSPTLAIAYIMKHLNMSSDDAYRYVKDKRPTISPNFNFLGQLLAYEKKLKMKRENHDVSGADGMKQNEQKLWSNYIMDLQTSSPSSPKSKNVKPFSFEVSPPSEVSSAKEGADELHHSVVVEQERTESMVVECPFPSSSDSMVVTCPFPGSSESTVPNRGLDSQMMEVESATATLLSPFPCSSESSISNPVSSESNSRTFRENADIPFSFTVETSSIESWQRVSSFSGFSCPSSGPISLSNSFGGFSSNPLPFGRPRSRRASPFSHQTEAIRENSFEEDVPPSPDNNMCDNFNSGSLTVSGKEIVHDSESRSTNQRGRTAIPSSLKLDLSSPVTRTSDSFTSVCTSLSYRDRLSKPYSKRPARTSLSLALSPVVPDTSLLPLSERKGMMCSLSQEKLFSSLSPLSPSPSSPSSPLHKDGERSSLHLPSRSSVTTSHTVKLKSFTLSASSSVTLDAQSPTASPTASLAKLNFNNQVQLDQNSTQVTKVDGSEVPPFKTFPTTSLDKLNFTPCYTKGCESGAKSGGSRRPLNNNVLDVKLSEPVSPLSVCSTISTSSNSSFSSSSVPSPTTGTAKVVMRSREGRGKRPMVRPNSIAFSSYPTCDLGSDCQDSPGSSSSATSQDDSSESYMLQNGKKSKPSEYLSDVRFRLGRYSEREVYRQITAAMESAMRKTQAFEASKKSRSLDDILNSEEESSGSSCDCPSFNKMLRHTKRYSSPGLMFDSCRCGGATDPYQSNSSMSSGGSHNSLHGSLEIIQVSSDFEEEIQQQTMRKVKFRRPPQRPGFRKSTR